MKGGFNYDSEEETVDFDCEKNGTKPSLDPSEQTGPHAGGPCSRNFSINDLIANLTY